MTRIVSLSLFFTFCYSLLFAQSSLAIRETTPFPDSVLNAASAMLPDGRVMVWGGTKQATIAGKAWISKQSYLYDPQEESWTAGPDLPAEVSGPLVLTLANGNLLSIGGDGYQTIAGIDSLPLRTDNVHMLDVTTLTWTAIADVPFGDSPYTGTSGVLLPDSNVWMTTTNGDYGTLDTKTFTWANQTNQFGPLDAGGRPIVVLDNGIIFHTGAGGQYYDMANALITYANPVVPLHPQNVLKLTDGRILTWDDEFSFSQEAIMVAENGLSSTFIDSLPIPGQLTSGVQMPDGKVWVFGWGEVGLGPYTIMQVFDPATDTWSIPGTYDFKPEITTGYHMHLLADSSLVVITTGVYEDGSPTPSYRIGTDATTGIPSAISPPTWTITHAAGSQVLHAVPPYSPQMGEATLEVMNLEGKVLLQKTVASAATVSLTPYPSGVYLARITSDSGPQIWRKIRLD